MNIVKIHRGDDTSAFNGGLFQVVYTDEMIPVQRMEIRIGKVCKTYDSLTFPVQVNLTACESHSLPLGRHHIELSMFDINGKRLTVSTTSMLEVVEPFEHFKIPYTSPVLVDLGDIFPSYEISRVTDYLYYDEVKKLDYEYAIEYMKENQQPESEISGGGCSSVRIGDFYGRNFDWFYSKEASVVVRTENTIGVAGGMSFCTDDSMSQIKEGMSQNDRRLRLIPFFLLDGVNKKGLFINNNIVHRETSKGTNRFSTPLIESKDEICSLMIPRYVLDRFDNALEAIEYIRDYVTVYTPKYLDEQDYECHFMVGDKEHTYIMEIINGTVTYREYNIMTNYYLDGVTFNEDNTLYSIIDTPEHTPSVDNGLSMYSSGVERHNILAAFEGSMRERMNVILYTQTYTGEEGADFWYSEYTGLGLGIDNTVAEYEENGRIGRIKEQYINRTRDDRNTWQTTHSSVYNLKDLTLNIVVQEDTEHEYNYSLEN